MAVTGTIALDGTVGPVGGGAQKAVTVRDGGYEVFLVPSDELEEVQRGGRRRSRRSSRWIPWWRRWRRSTRSGGTPGRCSQRTGASPPVEPGPGAPTERGQVTKPTPCRRRRCSCGSPRSSRSSWCPLPGWGTPSSAPTSSSVRAPARLVPPPGSRRWRRRPSSAARWWSTIPPIALVTALRVAGIGLLLLSSRWWQTGHGGRSLLWIGLARPGRGRGRPSIVDAEAAVVDAGRGVAPSLSGRHWWRPAPEPSRPGSPRRPPPSCSSSSPCWPWRSPP